MVQAAPIAMPDRPDAGPKRRKLRWRLFGWAVIAAIWGALAVGLALLWFTWDMPRPDAALDASRRPSLTLEDRSGRTFATFGDLVGDPVRIGELPPYVAAAAVSVEDRRFYSHAGVDLVGMLRAAVVNLRAGHVVQGGSTITQQVAKTLFLTNARTARRKVQEMLLALWLESRFSKRQILEIWLNRVYLGSGAWGVDAAARLYFGVPAKRLALWQAAVIAGLPRAPSRFNPRANPDAATARAKEVLAAMADTGAVTAPEAQRAAAEIAFPPRPPSTSGWFADWAAEQSANVMPEDQDAVLRTTFEPRVQAIAEARLAALLDGPGAAAGAGEGAVAVLDAATGAVRALVGGRDLREGGFNRAVQARRQPGSSFKPFVWLAALDRGARPDDTVLDAPVRIGGYSPANFERRYLGPISVEEALAQSVNTAAVRLEQQAGGPRAVAAAARRLGLPEAFPANWSLALGTTEVGLLELTGAYASFFNGGVRVTPYGVESYRAGRHVVPTGHAMPERAMEPEEAAMMARMLGAVVARGTGRSAAVPGAAAAGKTGTTQDYRDAWFIGCVNGTMIGVWLGNDDGRPMRGVTGGSLPARLFGEIGAAIAAR
jgi:penicillin-binding protein 1A